MARKTDVAPAKKVLTPLQCPCDYCGHSSVGAINGIPYCRDHAWDAMDGKKPMAVEPAGKRFMPYATAKPVAGE